MTDEGMRDTLTQATDAAEASATADTQAQKPETEPAAGTPRDEPPVVTRHALVVAGTSLEYTATTGRVGLRNDKGEIDAHMFFIAYTVEQPEGSAPRPLTFVFNGGPG